MNKVIKWIKMYVGRKVMIRPNGQDIINHINTHWTNQEVNYHKPSNEGMWLLFNSSPDHDIKKLR